LLSNFLVNFTHDQVPNLQVICMFDEHVWFSVSSLQNLHLSNFIIVPVVNWTERANNMNAAVKFILWLEMIGSCWKSRVKNGIMNQGNLWVFYTKKVKLFPYNFPHKIFYNFSCIFHTIFFTVFHKIFNTNFKSTIYHTFFYSETKNHIIQNTISLL
jgi:hypothetical protein